MFTNFCIILRVLFFRKKFYNNYIKTGKIDENGNYIEQTGDAAAYWGILTFCPFEIYDDYADMGHVYNFADLGFETNLYNNNNNDTVRNNYFTFNGNTATTQNIVNGWHINNQGYTSDAFDFFKNSGEDIRYSGDENHMSPADAIWLFLKLKLVTDLSQMHILRRL